jgi:glutaredoxin
MKYQLELFYFPECPYCQIVLDAISRYGLGKYIELLHINENPNFAKRLMEDTGRRTVPCLYINNKPMHESRDIANWLAKNSQEIINGN